MKRLRPVVMLNVRMGTDEARKLLVNEAAEQLKPEFICASTKDVKIWSTVRSMIRSHLARGRNDANDDANE